MLVFDLDPGEGTDIIDCSEVAIRLRDLLGGAALTSLVKTSGSKGLQLYVPLNVDVDYATTRQVARQTAELLARAHPASIVSRMRRAERTGDERRQDRP